MCGLYWAVMPMTWPTRLVQRRLAHDAGHFVVEQKSHALLARARFQRPHHRSAVGRVGTLQPGALGPDRMIFPRRRIAGRRRALVVRRFIGKLDAVLEQKLERDGAVIGEGAHDRAIIVTEIGRAVGLDDRPIGEVGKYRVRRIGNIILLLRAGAAAKSHMAAADDRMAADIVVRLDDDHRRPIVDRLDRCGDPRRARTDYDNVRLEIPVVICRLCHTYSSRFLFF